MDKKNTARPSTKKKKKKYGKPKLSRHGTLQGIAENVTGITSCCVTQRLTREPARTDAVPA